MSHVTLPGYATVEVIRRDMTKSQADVIVNVANGRLEHGGGIPKAVADAGIIYCYSVIRSVFQQSCTRCGKGLSKQVARIDMTFVIA